MVSSVAICCLFWAQKSRTRKPLLSEVKDFYTRMGACSPRMRSLEEEKKAYKQRGSLVQKLWMKERKHSKVLGSLQRTKLEPRGVSDKRHSLLSEENLFHRPDATLCLLNYLIAVFTSALHQQHQPGAIDHSPKYGAEKSLHVLNQGDSWQNCATVEADIHCLLHLPAAQALLWSQQGCQLMRLQVSLPYGGLKASGRHLGTRF